MITKKSSNQNHFVHNRWLKKVFYIKINNQKLYRFIIQICIHKYFFSSYSVNCKTSTYPQFIAFLFTNNVLLSMTNLAYMVRILSLCLPYRPEIVNQMFPHILKFVLYILSLSYYLNINLITA